MIEMEAEFQTCHNEKYYSFVITPEHLQEEMKVVSQIKTSNWIKLLVFEYINYQKKTQISSYEEFPVHRHILGSF